MVSLKRMYDLYKWHTPSNSIGIWLKSWILLFTSNSLRGSWWTTRRSILCCSGSTWRTLRRLSPPVTGTTSSLSSTGSSSARPQSKVLPLLSTLKKNNFYLNSIFQIMKGSKKRGNASSIPITLSFYILCNHTCKLNCDHRIYKPNFKGNKMQTYI